MAEDVPPVEHALYPHERGEKDMIGVLIIAPQKHTAESIAGALDGQRMLSTTVSEGTQALEQLDHNPPDAVVLAMGAQAEPGEELCRAVCERTLAPVLVAGRRGQAPDGE